MLFVSHRRAVLVLLLSTTGLFLSPASYSQRAPDPNTVTVVFSPIDKNGNVITTLTRADVRVYDDGTPQIILSFERRTEQPISVALLIDSSVSQARLQETAKLTARVFVETLMRPGIDHVSIVGFTGKPAVAQELTTDKQTVITAIERLHFATPASVAIGAIISGSLPDPDPEFDVNGATALWATVWNASEGLSVSRTEGTRRAILLISNGEDTASARQMREAIDRALKHDVAVYSIAMGDKNYGGINKGALKKIAEETGGRSFFPREVAELQNIFRQLEGELRSPYVIRYTRTNRKPSGEIQRLKIQLVRPSLENLKVNHRRGYASP